MSNGKIFLYSNCKFRDTKILNSPTEIFSYICIRNHTVTKISLRIFEKIGNARSVSEKIKTFHACRKLMPRMQIVGPGSFFQVRTDGRLHRSPICRNIISSTITIDESSWDEDQVGVRKNYAT